jgi:hypothetical protein
MTGAALALLLAGCSAKFDTVTPQVQATMMADLQAGKLNLDCGLNCRLTWDTSRPQIHALDLAEHWQDLTVQVMKIGYGNDLAYYYLGQAAQGLGYHQAAIGYYTFALGLATGNNPLLKCSASSSDAVDACQGVDIVGSVPVLIAASRDAIAQQQAAAAAAAATPAPAVHHRKKKPATPSSTASGSGWLAPPPAQGTPASAAGTAAPSGSGWLAPPPAAPAQ